MCVCVTDVRLWCGMCMTIYVCARSCDTVCARVYVLMYIYICVRELIFICLRVHMCVCVCVSSVSSLDQLLHFWPPPISLLLCFCNNTNVRESVMTETPRNEKPRHSCRTEDDSATQR